MCLIYIFIVSLCIIFWFFFVSLFFQGCDTRGLGDSLAPFTQEKTHKSHRCSTPILCRASVRVADGHVPAMHHFLQIHEYLRVSACVSMYDAKCNKQSVRFFGRQELRWLPIQSTWLWKARHVQLIHALIDQPIGEKFWPGDPLKQ